MNGWEQGGLRATVAVVGLAYLLGSISFSLMMVRWRLGRDLRLLGSGNAGATNVLRTTGPAAAVLVLLMDVGKGYLAVSMARRLGVPTAAVAAAAVAAVVGHVWPLFHGFRGGKGVATAAGTMAALALGPTVMSVGIWVLVTAATRLVALASVLAVAVFPLFVVLAPNLGWAPPSSTWVLWAGVAIAALIVAKHRENFQRLREGGEWKVGEPRKLDRDPPMDRKR